jgi:hypothetical protein
MAVALTVFFFIVVAIGFFSLAGNFLIGAFYVLGKILPVLLGSVAVIVAVILILGAICR